MPSEIIRYKSAEGEDIELTQAKVAQYMVSGNARNVTDSEFMRFMQLCKANRLNPFINEAYLVKYGDSPAAIVPGKEVFTKRAYRNKKFRGMEAGITVVANNQLVRREGCMALPGEVLVGGWCKVHVDGYAVPIYEEVPLSEYNTGKSSWKKMPGTMIRKVAMCHALREAFPEDLGGLYDSSEMGVEDAPAPQPAEAVTVAVEDAQPIEQPETNPVRAAWDAVGAVKAQALSMGITEDGLKSWAAVTFLKPDGSPKPMRDYAPEEVYAFRDYISGLVADKQRLEAEKAQEAEYEAEAEYEMQGEYDAAELASRDIPF